jgi:tRNA dimethylallyltransferase
VPIICGGSGFYIDALVYDQQFPDVAINKKLRGKITDYSAEKLFTLLSKKDPERAKTIDLHNKVRLIRALEIVEALGKVPRLQSGKGVFGSPKKYDYIIIGIKTDAKKLQDNIHKRLIDRMKSGMTKEILDLHKSGLSWKRMEELGLEYRYLSRFLRRLITKEQMLVELELEINKYVKRQMTWFKRNTDIQWFDLKNKGIREQIEKHLR